MSQQAVCDEPQVQEVLNVHEHPQPELSVGILIIGSLFWDDCESRVQWRASRLDTDAECPVRAPIRYGRCSETRGNTYTMVFSRSCLQPVTRLGQAKVIRCKNKVRSPQDLVTEAEWLWAAEDKKAQRSTKISAGWGRVGLLVNPRSAVPDELRAAWARRVRKESHYGRFSHTEAEGPVISSSGLFNLPWPELCDGSGPVPVDLLLATATNPTLVGDPPDYPDAATIAEAWNRDSEGNVRYFHGNRKSGILTFQDDEIRRALKVQA